MMIEIFWKKNYVFYWYWPARYYLVIYRYMLCLFAPPIFRFFIWPVCQPVLYVYLLVSMIVCLIIPSLMFLFACIYLVRHFACVVHLADWISFSDFLFINLFILVYKIYHYHCYLSSSFSFTSEVKNKLADYVYVWLLDRLHEVIHLLVHINFWL